MKEEPRCGLKTVFGDLHLHIGRTGAGEPVKISASRELTFRSIAHEAATRKGIHLLGVIDAHAPGVQRDIAALLESGEMEEMPGGGIRYGAVTLVLGAELEVFDAQAKGPAHYLAYLPTFEAMQAFTAWLALHVRNVSLSSQRVYVSGRWLQAEVKERGGLFIPAHVFTPHKSLYGSATGQLELLLDPDAVDAIELGLSADTALAALVPELDRYPFLSNSDAHSLGRIGREYNAFALREPSFAELALALRGQEGRGIVANYGLHPALGKYHSSRCAACGGAVALAEAVHEAEYGAEAHGTENGAEAGGAENGAEAHGTENGAEAGGAVRSRCAACGAVRVVRGVEQRIRLLGRQQGRTVAGGLAKRPPYIHQTPLQFIPGIGPKMLNRLLERFGTEMVILHSATEAELAEVCGKPIAATIAAARAGQLTLVPGGGGRYGAVGRT